MLQLIFRSQIYEYPSFARPCVLAVGPGKRDDNGKQVALDVKVGDRVLFGKYAGQAVKVDGQEVLVMREEDIMGVLQA